MQSAVAKLPKAPVEPHAELQRLQDLLAESERQREEHEQILQEHERRIEQLLDYITVLKRKRFGPSADRIPADQLKLFDEAELEALIAELEEEAEPPAASTPKAAAPEKPKDKPYAAPCRHTCRAWSASSICPRPRNRPWDRIGP